jgi:DNA-directed RNA polymerase specialized sigma24 family protein
VVAETAAPPLRAVSDRELVVLAARLPAREREALLLRYIGGLGMLQVATLLEVDLERIGRLHDAAHARMLEAVAAHDADAGGVGVARREAMRRHHAPSTVLRARRLALLPS